MLCLRCRALPSVRPSMPARPLNRYVYTQHRHFKRIHHINHHHHPLTHPPQDPSRRISNLTNHPNDSISLLLLNPLLNPNPPAAATTTDQRQQPHSVFPTPIHSNPSRFFILVTITSDIASPIPIPRFLLNAHPRRAPFYLQSLAPGAEATARVPVAVEDQERAEDYPAPEAEGEEEYELVD